MSPMTTMNVHTVYKDKVSNNSSYYVIHSGKKKSKIPYLNFTIMKVLKILLFDDLCYKGISASEFMCPCI